MIIEIDKLQKTSLTIAINLTQTTIAELLRETPKTTPQYDDLIEVYGRLEEVKVKLSKQ